MIPDIFSTFDPYSSRAWIPITSIFLITNLIILSIIRNKLFSHLPRLTTLFNEAVDVITTQLLRTGAKSLKGFTGIITALFILIISLNLLGIAPYTFRLSRHLIITLTLGLPLWLRLIISRFRYAPKQSTAHFLPDGAPDWLNPFLVLIETTRVFVRPLTLSFRLAANITAGHIVLGLVGIYGAAALLSSIKTSLFLLTVRIGYILFEFAICIIQAYIFCLLLSLYRDDHAH